MIDLRSLDSARQATSATARDLANAARKLNSWTPQALENADRVLLALAMRACARSGDREEIGEVQRAITQLTLQANSAHSLPDRYRDRWQAFADLLEARRLQLAGASPEGLLSRRHVRDIMSAVLNAADSLPQSKVREHLESEISAGRITQVLNLMESHELIERVRSGRDNHIEATARGRALAPELASGTKPKLRGAGVFRLEAA